MSSPQWQHSAHGDNIETARPGKCPKCGHYTVFGGQVSAGCVTSSDNDVSVSLSLFSLSWFGRSSATFTDHLPQRGGHLRVRRVLDQIK